MDIFDVAWVNHVERLEENWKSVVAEGDTVLIPGDISWGIDLEQAMPDLQFIDSLPGKKVLLRGNHDYWWASMAKMRPLFDSISFIQNDCYEGEDYVLAGSRGWLFPWSQNRNYTEEEIIKIYKRELLRTQMALTCANDIRGDKKLIAVTHFPPLDPEHYRTEFTDLYQTYDVDMAIYGHLHGNKQINAVEGLIDGIEYRLVSLDRLDATPAKIL